MPELSGVAKREAVLVAAVSQEVVHFLGACQKSRRSSSRVTCSIDENMTRDMVSSRTCIRP